MLVLQDMMQDGMKAALNWFLANTLLCNPDENQQIILGLSNEFEVQAVKILGIHVDSKLTWETHVNNICAKLARVTYLIGKVRYLVSKKYLRVDYFGLSQS